MAREIAQTHGAIAAMKSARPAHDQSARKRFRQIAYGMATSSGRAIATGPLVITPKPMASQARADHFRPGTAGVQPASSSTRESEAGETPALPASHARKKNPVAIVMN